MVLQYVLHEPKHPLQEEPVHPPLELFEEFAQYEEHELLQEDPVHPDEPPFKARSSSSLSSSHDASSPGITPTARIGNTRFAAFLKKSLRERSSSFLSFFISCVRI